MRFQTIITFLLLSIVGVNAIWPILPAADAPKLLRLRNPSYFKRAPPAEAVAIAE